MIYFQVYALDEQSRSYLDSFQSIHTKAGKAKRTRVVISPFVMGWIRNNVHEGDYIQYSRLGNQVSKSDCVWKLSFKNEEDFNLLKISLGHLYVFAVVDE